MTFLTKVAQVLCGVDEVLSNLDQPSLCLSLIRSAQIFLLNSVFGILISDLMILTNIFGFSNNIVAAFPGKPVLFTENYKALSRNTSRYENQEVIYKQSSLENEEEKSEEIKEDIHQEFKKEDSTNEDENENQDKDENEDENENKAVIENSRVISTMTDLKPQLGLIPNETDDESKDEDEDDDENNLINRYQNYPTTKENSTQDLSQSLVQYDKKYPVKMMTSMENPGNLSDLTETQIKYVKPPRSNNNISKNSSSTTKNKYHSTNTHMAPNVKKFMEWEDEKLEEFWEDRGWKGKETKIKFNFDSDGNITIDPVTPAVTDHDSKELDVINEELVHSPNTT